MPMRDTTGLSKSGYNWQAAVDAKHCLIIHHAVCQGRNDQRQHWMNGIAKRKNINALG
jgi:hypothetical protein